MLVTSIKQAYSNVPQSIKLFAKKALIIFVAWLALYYGIMQPARVPDRWLTNVTGNVTTAALNGVYKQGFTNTEYVALESDAKNAGSLILFNNQTHVLFIADPCNAFDLYVLYLAFLFCLPTTVKRVVLFSLAGIAGIFILNVLRCFALSWLSLNKPEFVDFAHHYAFTIIVYSCIFAAWVAYAKKYKLAAAEVVPQQSLVNTGV